MKPVKHEVLPIPAGALIRQSGRACFHDLVNTCPVLVQVRSGTKVVMGRDAPLRLAAGEFGLLPDNQPITMENIPKVPQVYEARALAVPRALFEEAYLRLSTIQRPQYGVPAKAVSLPDEAVALFDFCCGPGNLARLPLAVATVRLMELITWFALSGAVLGKMEGLSLQDRLRQLIEKDPGGAWAVAQAAGAFHMSEATLRRKLTAEGTSFSEILSDTRMTRALGLLHTTTLPIAHVAQEVGYDSPSQFAARFKERFGINPRDIRGDREILERSGTGVR